MTNKTKTKTQYVLDTTMRKQTQLTEISSPTNNWW